MSMSTARHSPWPIGKDAHYLGPHQGTEPIDVTVVLRRRGGHPTPAAWPHHAPCKRADFDAQWGADPADADKLRGFARQHGLTETGCELHRRVMHLRGTPQQLQQAFGVQLGSYQVGDGGPIRMGCHGKPTLPSDVSPAVVAVLGLDQRPVARPHFRRLAAAAASTSYTPLQVGELYDFPADADGTGQTVAIIELGGGYTTSDFTQYMQALGIDKVPKVDVVSVAGGGSQPGGDADGEVMLDVEVIGALAQGAAIAIYFAPNTDQGFYEAISQAAHDSARNPSVISISWGGPEDSWASTTLQAMESALQDASTLGVTVTAASGDSGSTDGETDGQQHVDYPASSAYVLACGGTTLSGAGTISSETVWNELASDEGATGGGVSTAFGLPTWQASAQVPAGPNGASGRGVPDVAGNADPQTGYQVRVDGQDQVIGGTSAVAPLWAALIARFNQQLGQNLGDVHEAIYGIGEQGFRDITQGDNGAYQAASGWDACTGWGSPKGQPLLAALSSLKNGAGAS